GARPAFIRDPAETMYNPDRLTRNPPSVTVPSKRREDAERTECRRGPAASRAARGRRGDFHEEPETRPQGGACDAVCCSADDSDRRGGEQRHQLRRAAGRSLQVVARVRAL